MEQNVTVVFSSVFFRTQKLLFLHYKLLLTSLQTHYKTLLTILQTFTHYKLLLILLQTFTDLTTNFY